MQTARSDARRSAFGGAQRQKGLPRAGEGETLYQPDRHGQKTSASS
jgi:hypothetical protein